ncbi:SDR family oxidoreductase [Azospirillum sp. SYSU D00513]|uniref:SDR family oxidoreductase n=1 Tax=Azospirillum sp. SYSU D00513 TaxID=2812561 RepID=UPI001A965590
MTGLPVTDSLGAALGLQGKAAIVTGAARGIGAAIAQGLHAAGVSVALADIDGAGVQAGAAALGERALPVAMDLRDDHSLDACVEAAATAFGRLDILVNAACTYQDKGLGSTRAEWLEALNVNLVGAAILTDKAAARMGEGGVVVNIGSVGGKFGAAGRALYPASKAALMQFTKNAAVSLAPKGIRVVTVSPAWTWSPALEALAGTPEHADAVGGSLHPAGRVGRGEDVSGAVLLACSGLAGFVTGVDIPVDGGFSALGPDQGRGPKGWFGVG